ncbi:hypothetical protein OG985_20860 [Streptomyces sp. NBC_00289]|uniref:hypothetical protein n=1 Tax=Streptomyces sp. NBC_00289 TaxID=2975703 RepID=UPI0032569720
MPAQLTRNRRRLLVAGVLVLTAFALTGCEDGKGVRDEGPAAAGLRPAGPAAAERREGRPDKGPSGLEALEGTTPRTPTGSTQEESA